MANMNRVLLLFVVLVFVFGGFCAAETYHLSGEKGWQNVADLPEGEYLLAVSKIKQQLLSGDDAAVMDALEQLKADYPDLAGAQIDAFIEAEQLYADAVWHKAAVKYKQFLDTWPDSVLYPAAIERLFSIGVAYMQGEKRRFIKVLKLPAFDDGAALMRDIADREGNSPMALRALTALAENQERKKKYFEAYQTWAEIATRWPTGKTAQEALLKMPQELHASYRGAEFDAASLDSAKSYYEDFIMRYPKLATELGTAQEIALIEEQRAYKHYETGFYYDRTGKPDVARMYYDKVIAIWPDSKAAEMARVRLDADAPPAIEQTRRRKLFDVGNTFLDSWFGIAELLFDEVLPEDGDNDVIPPVIPGEDM